MIPAPALIPPAPVRRPILVALIVACAMFMEQFDGTVISTALPAMAKSFDANPIRLNLAITSYMLSLAVFIPVSGWVADRFGAKKIFRAAIVVFMLGSLCCGFSNSLGQLTASRLIQGVGGAMMVPVGRLVLLRSVEKSDLVRAMAYLMVPAQMGPILGPPIGGFITTYLNWRWIFFLNLPIGLIGIVLVTIFIQDTREGETHPLDLGGFALSGVSLSCLIYGLDQVGRVPDSLFGWELLLGGASLFAVTIYHSLHHPHPLVDLSLCAVPSFGVSLMGGSLFRLGVGALPFLLPLMLQVGFGLSAFASGLLTFASAGGSMAMKLTAAPILRRFGFRTVLVANAAISGVSILACAFFTRHSPLAMIFSILLVGGFFRSLQFTSLNVMAYADIPGPRMSAATSLYGMVQQVSIGAGVAIGALLLHVGLALHIGGSTAKASANLPVPADFQFAFAVVGALSALSFLQFLKLPPNAGAEVTGYKGRVPLAPVTKAP